VFNEAGEHPVILTHGALGSAEDWGFEVPRLAKSHKVLVIDCRGRGRSTMGSQPLTYGLMTSDLIGVMDALHIPKASIVGASDGGIIGLYMAIHHPDRIDKLLAWGANYSVSHYEAMPMRPEMKAAGAQYLAHAKATYIRLSPTPDGFPQLLAAVGRMTEREPEIAPAELATIRAPTVIADGEYEQFISRKETTTLARLIPGARLVIVPGVSHGGPVQAPDAFHRIVSELLLSRGGHPRAR
jgi:pimeloyl-ACP methyl ester carboxylesterase